MSNENVKKIPSDAPESVFSERQVGQESQSDWSSQNAKNTQNAQSSQTCSQDSDNCVTSVTTSSSDTVMEGAVIPVSTSSIFQKS